MRTWHGETAVVGVALAGVALASGGGALELLGATAVLLSFGHASVAERLRERDAARMRPSVECHRWATRYLVGKEALWFLYFVMHRSWAALAGVLIFLLYPSWRKLWRRHHPLAVEMEPVALDVGGDGSPYRAAGRARGPCSVDPCDGCHSFEESTGIESDRTHHETARPTWARDFPMPGPPDRRSD